MSLFTSFKASTPGRQVALVAAAAAALCGLMAAAYFLFLRTEYGVLFSDLREADAATIVAELDQAKIPYRLDAKGTRILVPEELVDGTRLNIMGRDLPIKGMVGFELFNKSDMGLTEFAQKINYQRALQGELARTIMTMDTVETARVHLSLTERTIFRDDKVPPEASVTVVPRMGKPLSRGTVRGIQRLVAASVPELDLANVVVLDNDGEVMSGDAPVEAAPSPQLRQKQAVEQSYASQIEQAMERGYPAAKVEVTVWAGPLPSGLGAEAAAAADPSWNPEQRNFRLHVALAVDDDLDSRAHEEMSSLAGEVIGLSPALGDQVTVSVLSSGAADEKLSSDDPSTASADRVAPGPASSSGADMALGFGFWAAIALLALLAALVLRRRRESAPRALTEQQRSDFVDRFKVLLEQGERDAVRGL